MLTVFAIVVAFVIGVLVGHVRRTPPPLAPVAPEAEAVLAPLPPLSSVPFDAIAARESDGWKTGMRDVGARLRAADVSAIVFVHGTFTGHDPLSAIRAVERALPTKAAVPVADALRKVTRATVDRLLGDLGQFNAQYTDLFERGINEGAPAGARRIPCTSFAWSSENHHLGRVEAALGLLRVLATHHEIGGGRILVLGHSHAGQVFALVTQMLASALTTEAIRDVARARGLDVGAYDIDRLTLVRASIDFVTFGAPNRYAWAKRDRTRALHVVSGNGDLVQRLGGRATDFPPIDAGDRKVNTALETSLGASFAAGDAVRALWTTPSHDDRNVVLVDYGDANLLDKIGSGLGHGGYTRLDGMLFHADLVTRMLYTSSQSVASNAVSDSSSATNASSSSDLVVVSGGAAMTQLNLPNVKTPRLRSSA